MKSSVEVEGKEGVANMKWEGLPEVEMGLFWETCETIRGITK